MKPFYLILLLGLAGCLCISGAYVNDTNAGLIMRPYGSVGVYYDEPRKLGFYWSWRLTELGTECVDVEFSFGGWRMARSGNE